MNRWPTKQLGDVAEFINGRAFEPSDWSSKGIPIIRIQNLTDPTASYNRFDGTFDQRHAVRDGDLLVSWSATLDVFAWNRGDAVLNQHIFRVVPDSTLVSKTYLFYALKSVMGELRSKTHGATMKHITKGPFQRTGIPVPPLAQQERIEKLLNEAEQLRKLRAQADRCTADLIPALFYEMFGDHSSNRARWPIVRVQEVARIIVPTRDRPRRFIGDIPWVTLPDLTGFFTETAKNLLSHEDAAAVGNRLMPPHTVLLSCAGSLGRVSVAVREIYANQQFYGLVPKQELIDPIFLAATLKFKGERFFHHLAGTSTLAFFSKQRALEIELILPPLSIQRRFAAGVTELHSLIAQQAASRERLDALFQSMLHRAFNGDL